MHEGLQHCKAIEDIINETSKIQTYEITARLIKRNKYSFKEISEITGLTLEEIQEIANEVKVQTE